jgi:V/A-type H+/Na+-transporting ATPase subunit K
MELEALQFAAERANLLGLPLAVLGSAVAVTLACIGSIIGVAAAGQAGAGLLTEKPKMFGQVMVIEALPGSQGIYGMVVAFLVLIFFKIGAPDQLPLTYATGMSVLAACLPVGFAGLLSAPFQGKVCAAGMKMMAKDDKAGGKVIIMAVVVETFAILGFLISFLALLNISNGLAA